MPPFFIMGCPRSGTTLVSQLLDGHARMAVFVESMYYPLFRPDLDRYGDLRRPANAHRLIVSFLEMVHLHGLYRVEPPNAEEIQAGLVAPTFEGVLVTFLDLYARRQGKARCGEKTARHHEFVPDILERLPESAIIFVMRDPRDAVRSIRKMFDARLEDAVEWWNQAFRSYQRTAGRAFLLRYEELVREPRLVLEHACSFLGEDYDPAMQEFFQQVPNRLREAAHHQKLAKPVDAASVGGFRDMPADDIARIEAWCADGMETLGYTPASATWRAAPPFKRIGRGRKLLDRLWRFRKRPDLIRLGWRRWKMRFRVLVHDAGTLGPFRRAIGHA